MFHISEKLSTEPLERDDTIHRLANILMTYLQVAAQTRSDLPEVDAITSIRQDIYKLSMQIKQGLPCERHVVTDDTRLELINDILQSVPMEAVPTTLWPTLDVETEVPELNVFPDLDGDTPIQPSYVHAINMLIEKTIHLDPQTMQDYRVMCAKLHILALLTCCVLVFRLEGHRDVFTDDYRQVMVALYRIVKAMYLW